MHSYIPYHMIITLKITLAHSIQIQRERGKALKRNMVPYNYARGVCQRGVIKNKAPFLGVLFSGGLLGIDKLTGVVCPLLLRVCTIQSGRQNSASSPPYYSLIFAYSEGVKGPYTPPKLGSLIYRPHSCFKMAGISLLHRHSSQHSVCVCVSQLVREGGREK